MAADLDYADRDFDVIVGVCAVRTASAI